MKRILWMLLAFLLFLFSCQGEVCPPSSREESFTDASQEESGTLEEVETATEISQTEEGAPTVENPPQTEEGAPTVENPPQTELPSTSEPPMTQPNPVLPPATEPDPVLPPATEPDPVLPPATEPDPVSPPATEPDPVFSDRIFYQGKSEYVLVYDPADSAAAQFARDLSDRLLQECGVTLQLHSVANSNTTHQKEIIVGNARKKNDPLVKKYDFSVLMEQNSLHLTARCEISYRYLTEYLFREIFSQTKEGELTLSSENNVVHSSSALSEVSYLEYWMEKNGACTPQLLVDASEAYSFKGSNGMTMKYRISLPFHYDPEKEYPMLLFLHGAGHRGNDNLAPIKGMPYALYSHESVPMQDAILLVPQCPKNYQWVDTPWSKGNYNINSIPESKAMACLMELLDDILKKYSVDEDRIYALGLSMGGFGTWDLVSRHPELFAAAVPICGGGSVQAVEVLKNLPIWTTHGDRDTSVPLEGTREMVSAIRQAGGELIHYTEFAGKGHSIGAHTAKQKEIMEWLFQQKRSAQ